MIVNKGQCASTVKLTTGGGEGGVGTLLYGLHRYVRSQKVGHGGFLEATFSSFLKCFWYTVRCASCYHPNLIKLNQN